MWSAFSPDEFHPIVISFQRNIKCAVCLLQIRMFEPWKRTRFTPLFWSHSLSRQDDLWITADCPAQTERWNYSFLLALTELKIFVSGFGEAVWSSWILSHADDAMIHSLERDGSIATNQSLWGGLVWILRGWLKGSRLIVSFLCVPDCSRPLPGSLGYVVLSEN